MTKNTSQKHVSAFYNKMVATNTKFITPCRPEILIQEFLHAPRRQVIKKSMRISVISNIFKQLPQNGPGA